MINLYGILLENLDIDKLIEEGKDPKELLHYKFQYVPSEIIDSVISIDPTKKKSYSQWLLSKWNDEQDTIIEALKNGRLEKLFQYYKEHNEIQIKDCPSVARGLEKFVPQEEEGILSKSSKPTTYIENQHREVDSELANDFDIVFNKDNWIIAVPHTYEAAGKLGDNTRWCTTGCYGDDRFYRNYLRQGGEYYVNFDMSQGETLNGVDYPFTRYQFHFESKQFMNSHDNPVSLDDLNIPESAIEFYRDIDPDYEIGEKSWEERYEEYEQARWDDAIILNDDLYLIVSWDDDMEYVEPTENSDWYVFDNEDDRDPISYTEVDPNIDESIIFNNEDEAIIIRTKYDEDEYLALVRDSQERYRDWSVYKMIKPTRVPNYEDSIVAGFTMDNGSYKSRAYSFSVILDNQLFSENTSVQFDGNFNIAFNPNNVNPAIYNYEGEGVYAFIEVFEEDGYHSLFALTDSDLYAIIKRDLPKEGELFSIDEETEVIYGQFRTYYLDSSELEEENQEDFDLTYELPNGDYLVEKEETVENKYGDRKRVIKYNVLSKETRQLLFKEYFDELKDSNNEYYLIKNGNNISKFRTNGTPIITGNYNQIVSLSNDSNITVARGKDIDDLYDNTTGERIARFTNISTQYPPINNKIVVSTYDYELGSKITKIYDYIKRDWAYPQSTGEIICGNNLVLCKMHNQEATEVKNVLIDYSTDTILIDNIVEYERTLTPIKGAYLTLQDGKHNYISIEYGLCSPVNFDNVCDSKYACIQFQNNGKTFLYYYGNENDYYSTNHKHEFLINPNGYDSVGIFDNYGDLTFRYSPYIIHYNIKGRRFKCYSREGWGGREVTIDGNAPMEVLNCMYSLMGKNEIAQNMQQATANSMAEQFNRTLKRIDEARKLFR